MPLTLLLTFEVITLGLENFPEGLALTLFHGSTTAVIVLFPVLLIIGLSTGCDAQGEVCKGCDS